MAVEVQLQLKLENTLVTELRRSGLLRFPRSNASPEPLCAPKPAKPAAPPRLQALTQAGKDSTYEKVS